ncbi:unnamed protein product [Rhizopus microsporus]
MSVSENKKALVFSILEFLQKSCEDGTINKMIPRVLKLLCNRYSTKPANLLSIFDVYLNTKSKTSATKATGSTSAADATTSAPVEDVCINNKTTVSEEDKKEAEMKKVMGNRKVAERNYPEAIKLYSEAIALNPHNAVFYANRAAAYSQQGDHEKAVEDAKKALDIDPKYSKAYSRMGHAYFCLNKFNDAVDAYKKGLELDPENATLKNSLATATAKANASSVERSAEPSPAGGLPNLGAGGMPDLGSLLNNPALMNMAQQMMQSGALEGLMNNPAVARMAQQMMSGGAPPNLNEMMNNPEMMRMAREAMNSMNNNNNNNNNNNGN